MARPSRSLARSFAHPGVAAAYRFRPPYPPAVFDLLGELVVDRPRRALDLGAGEGAIARRLTEVVDAVDAVEPAPAMIQAGRSQPGGRAENLRWLRGTAESCPLSGPYALIVAGASFHWFDWPRTLVRLTSVMSDRAVLALIEHGPRPVPWQSALSSLIARFSRSPHHDPDFDIAEALRATGQYLPLGTRSTAPSAFRQPLTDYIESFHSTASLARELMTHAEAVSFDEQLEEIVTPYLSGGQVELQIEAVVRWGRPQACVTSKPDAARILPSPEAIGTDCAAHRSGDGRPPQRPTRARSRHGR